MIKTGSPGKCVSFVDDPLWAGPPTPQLCAGLPTPHAARPQVSLPRLCAGLLTPHFERPQVSTPTDNHQTRLLSLADARHVIHDADLLLFRRRSLISIAGRGTHSHAAKATWWDDELFCVEVREWHGGRAVTLASQVEKYPGRIDVYHTNPANRWPEYDRTRSTQLMRRLAGCDYGYTAVLAAAMLHLPFIRMAVRANVEDDAIDRRPPFCSQACVMCDRLGGGIDPVPHLADRLTEPADLARSPFYEYAFTLIP
ncbi:MAG: hypothetical protein U0805_20235 [Pirellulales bacterium]